MQLVLYISLIFKNIVYKWAPIFSSIIAIFKSKRSWGENKKDTILVILK